MHHRWSEPAMQMFLVYVSCKGGVLIEVQEQSYIQEIMAVYSREPLLHHHVSFVLQGLSLFTCPITTVFSLLAIIRERYLSGISVPEETFN